MKRRPYRAAFLFYTGTLVLWDTEIVSHIEAADVKEKLLYLTVITFRSRKG